MYNDTVGVHVIGTPKFHTKPSEIVGEILSCIKLILILYKAQFEFLVLIPLFKSALLVSLFFYKGR